jgi:hypothetical protein
MELNPQKIVFLQNTTPKIRRKQFIYLFNLLNPCKSNISC